MSYLVDSSLRQTGVAGRQFHAIFDGRIAMFTRRPLGFVVLIGMLAFVSHVSADAILSLDFGVAASPIETGFQGFDPSGSTMVQLTSPAGYFETFNNGTASEAYGPITVKETGALGLFDRDPTSPLGGSFSDLYRDFIFSNSGSFNIEIDGLNLDARYTLRLYSFDDNAGGTITNTFTPTIGSGTPGSVTYISLPGHAATSDDQYSTLVTWTTDGSGKLAFDVSATGTVHNDFPRLDGLVLDYAPEPSSLALALGVLPWLTTRRRSLHRD